MSQFDINEGAWEANISITKRQPSIALPTAGTYVDKNLNLNLSVQANEGTIGGTATNGSATAVLTNMHSINTLTASQVASLSGGTDYWQIKATALGNVAKYKPKYTVTQAGWLQSTVEASSATDITVTSDTTGQSLYIPKVVGNTGFATSSGTGTFNATVTPTISIQDVPLHVENANTGAGSATTVAPSSGVYVAVKSNASTGKLTATPTITTNGYGTSSNHGITANTATYGANASAVTYIPIKQDSVSLQGGNIIDTTATITSTNLMTSSSNTSGVSIVPHASAKRAAITSSDEIFGWINFAKGGIFTNGAETSASSWQAAAPTYITGVQLLATAHAGDTNTFDVIVPNGLEDTMTFRFIVDHEGNVTITDASNEEEE